MPISSGQNSNSEKPAYRLSDYRFDYPDELIAAQPAPTRDASRLFVLHKQSGEFEHRRFPDLPSYFSEGDCIVLNRSRVLPARILGKKETGGKIDLLLVEEREDGTWSALSADLKEGRSFSLGGDITGTALARSDSNGWIVRFSVRDLKPYLRDNGFAPLPPYIRRRRRETGEPGGSDLERYQTVYAAEEGSIAAPTAGLHFTPALLDNLRSRGVSVVEILLHVGLGTFLPVTASDVRDHAMLPESFSIDDRAITAIREAKKRGKKVVAVGTTVTRTLETYGENNTRTAGKTSLYITPGHRFKILDGLVTNFHQPESTPLLLASAFAGKSNIMRAYREAIKEKYRLFSYGDSMLIL
jgi:S-adenosylmethionine:tRNA ribosyltransferase-isomerase